MASARVKSRGILLAIREFFELPTPGAVRYVTVAAVTILLVQAVILGRMLTTAPGPAEYQTASGPREGVSSGTVAVVAFQDTATLADISRALSLADAMIIEGPLKGDLFKIRIAHGSDGEAGARRRLEALKAETMVVKTLLPSR